jgi:hypothetical protein
MSSKIALVFVIALLFTFAGPASAQSTEFTYQGRLLFGDAPANGNYDFEFALFDSENGGNQLGSNFPLSAVNVNNGVFSVRIDFGNQFPGANRFLEIHVKQSGSLTYAVLSPRQAISSAPYSIKSLNAANADTAANANQLGGVTANQFVVTTDSRLSDARAPLPDSANYVQNSTVRQPSSNFNVSGNGTVGGTLSANTVNVTSEYDINGNRFVSFPGLANTFVGFLTGLSNTTGDSNSIFGNQAGQRNTTGGANSFFGINSGGFNTTGSRNSFFGAAAGGSNTTGNSNSVVGTFAGVNTTSGSNNSFFGSDSGGSNSIESNNTFLGSLSNGVAGITNATAVGFKASVAQSNSLVLGSISGVNNATADTRVGIGTTAPAKHLHIFGSSDQEIAIQSSDSGGRMWTLQSSRGTSNGNFQIIDRSAGLSRLTIDLNGNVGVGTTAPSEKLQVNGNAVITGNLTVNGATNLPITTQYIWNSITQQPGSSFNIAGDGTVAGTLSGTRVSALAEFDIGAVRVLSNTGTNNLFAGASTGGSNTGFANTFIGAIAGSGNTSGSDNTFLGAGTGFNTTTGTRNTFIGQSSGTINITGSENTALGDNANVGSSGLAFATAIGASSFAGTSDTIVLGKNAGTYNGVSRPADNVLVRGNLGVGTSSPGAPVHIVEGTTGVAPHVFATLVLERNGNNFLNILAPDASSSGIFFGNPTDGNFAGQFNYNDGVAPNGFTFRVNGGFTRMVLTSGGNLGINTTAPSDKLEVNGVIRVDSLGAAGSTTLCRNASNQISTCSSSIRYKKNISSFTSGLDLIRRLRPVSFNWKADGTADFGLVAEAVNKVEPLLTTTNEKGEVEGVKYDRVGVVLVNAVNEQQTQIENEQKQISAQNEVIERQQAEIDALRKLVCSRHRSATACRSNR